MPQSSSFSTLYHRRDRLESIVSDMASVISTR
jgi:hypothetical protein